MTLLVSVVGRRMGGGFKVAEIVVCKVDQHTKDAECEMAARMWADMNALELKLWEVLP